MRFQNRQLARTLDLNMKMQQLKRRDEMETASESLKAVAIMLRIWNE